MTLLLTLSQQQWTRLVAAPAFGQQHQGYAPGGAQDRWSLACGNALLGNALDAGGLEISLAPPQIHVHADCHLVMTGAPVAIRCDGQDLDMHHVYHIQAGSTLVLQPATSGVRSYLCVAGGLQAAGDGYMLASAPHPAVKAGRRRPGWGEVNAWAPPRGWLRILPGPEWHSQAATLLQGPWRIDPQSSGMGLRLQGPRLPMPEVSMWSSPVADGTIQVSGSGPLLLLRQRQTIGGYPRVAVVIDADIDLAAQLRPGDALRLMVVDRAQAEEAAATRAAIVQGFLPK